MWRGGWQLGHEVEEWRLDSQLSTQTTLRKASPRARVRLCHVCWWGARERIMITLEYRTGIGGALGTLLDTALLVVVCRRGVVSKNRIEGPRAGTTWTREGRPRDVARRKNTKKEIGEKMRQYCTALVYIYRDFPRIRYSRRTLLLRRLSRYYILCHAARLANASSSSRAPGVSPTVSDN